MHRKLRNKSVRIDDIETKVKKIEDGQNVEFDPNVSIIVSKRSVTAGENIQEVVNEIVRDALDTVA